ncbi:MAG: alkyl hydroperoxide reductase [Planctomycetes bacterium SM23_65]|nr:MAG: alkyl hydroperoxide reductase [Planctomycetes bacterium SM23_65]
MKRLRGRVDAPEFPRDMQWLNTGRPLSLKELRGKVVVLDFWTYCCINCMHVLPQLKKLEHKYPNELVVIGVHSGKFTAEQDSENIRQAILRYEIEHPVLNDRDMTVWKMYDVHAWPTLCLIDPEGKLVATLSGEDVFDPFDRLISEVIREFDREGKVSRRRVPFGRERDRAPKTLLSFPGKVLADEKSARLFVADSNNNRIVVATLDGEIKDTIGGGKAGLQDGGFKDARFRKPQGMTLVGELLYVADTENHAIRRVDLDKKAVTTIAGTGKQSRNRPTYGSMEEGIPLNSPWDLVLHDAKLYVAMAGPHQLWVVNPATGAAGPYAGSGREARIDGPLADAALAQPSGITTDGEKLYFADSETSSIRSAELRADGRIETIVGVELFEFGDRDGTAAEVRLQHPLGVTYYQDILYVADTYNNKIKRIDPKTRKAETFLGTGEPGLRDGAEAHFDEPGGVSIGGGKLYIADTNNHVIRVADLKTKTVSTLEVK